MQEALASVNEIGYSSPEASNWDTSMYWLAGGSEDGEEGEGGAEGDGMQEGDGGGRDRWPDGEDGDDEGGSGGDEMMEREGGGEGRPDGEGDGRSGGDGMPEGEGRGVELDWSDDPGVGATWLESERDRNAGKLCSTGTRPRARSFSATKVRQGCLVSGLLPGESQLARHAIGASG